MKKFFADLRANPDTTFLFGMLVVGEIAATTVCLYFASTFPPQPY